MRGLFNDQSVLPTATPEPTAEPTPEPTATPESEEEEVEPMPVDPGWDKWVATNVYIVVTGYTLPGGEEVSVEYSFDTTEDADYIGEVWEAAAYTYWRATNRSLIEFYIKTSERSLLNWSNDLTADWVPLP